MKLLRSLLAISLVIVVLATSFPVTQVSAASDDVYYDRHSGYTYRVLNKKKKTAEIVEARYPNLSGAVVIPERVAIYTVVSIGDRAFYNAPYYDTVGGITSITIPSNVKTIGDEAFANRSALKKLVLSEGLTSIGESAFEKTSIKSVTLPSTLKTLNEYAFADCPELKKVVFNSLPEFKGWNSPFYNAGITTVVWPKNIKVIPNDLFLSCEITKLKIPDTVVEIGEDAFRGNPLTSIEIPASVKTIKNGAFAYANLSGTFVVPETVEDINLGAFYKNENLEQIIFQEGLKELHEPSYSWYGTKPYYVPDSVEEFGSYYSSPSNMHYNDGSAAYKYFGESAPHTTFTTTVVAPTCVDGYTLHTCECGYNYKDNIVPATEEHDVVNIPYKKATKDAPGCTEGSYCSKCNTVFEKSDTFPQIGSVTLKNTELAYTGEVRKPSVVIKDKNGDKIPAANYTVKIPESKKIGTYTVTVTFKGDYSGTISLEYKIVPKATSLSSFERSSGAIMVKWKAQTTNTTGYQLQYGKKKNLSDGKSIWIKNNKTTEKTIKKLSNAKYYFRLRTYKTVTKNGVDTKYYSAWTKTSMVLASKSTTMKVLNHWDKAWLLGSSTKCDVYQTAASSCVGVHAILKRDTYREFDIHKIYIYRATSKNGKYKLIKTLNGDKLYGEGFLRLVYDDTDVKPNKAYYYKIKLLYVPQFYSSSMGLGSLLPEQKIYDYISTTGAYRTSPKEVKRTKTKGSWLSWNKVKNINGYVVNERTFELEGYNIFGQPVYGVGYYEYSTTSVGCKSKLYSRLQRPGDSYVSYFVRPYKKVGKYYYCDGMEVRKKLDISGYSSDVYVGH